MFGGGGGGNSGGSGGAAAADAASAGSNVAHDGSFAGVMAFVGRSFPIIGGRESTKALRDAKNVRTALEGINRKMVEFNIKARVEQPLENRFK